MEPEFDDLCNDLRKKIKAVAAEAKELIQAAKADDTMAADAKGEMIANATLAYRHLEDASMRVGKAIQASDGGMSVYDKETNVGA